MLILWTIDAIGLGALLDRNSAPLDCHTTSFDRTCSSLDASLAVPGSVASFKVYVITTTGRVAGAESAKPRLGGVD